jgi:hypothetical protein
MQNLNRGDLDVAVNSEVLETQINTNVTARDVIAMIQQAQPHYTDDDILNIYLFGSRLYGTATEDSDFDLMVIVRDESFDRKVSREQIVTTSVDSDKRKTGFVQCEVNGCKLDATIYSKTYFCSKMNLYNIYEMMALWLPAAFVMLERFPLIDEWRDKDDNGNPVIDIPTLRTRISSQCTNVWKMCRKWYAYFQTFNIVGSQMHYPRKMRR